MALPTNRQAGQVVSAADINAIAAFINALLGSTAFAEAAQDVFGAMIQATGGTYTDNGDGTGSITLPAGSAGGATINDTTPSSTTVYSSAGTNAAIAGAVSNLVNGAGTALDTLSELASALGNDPSFATAMATALAARLRFDAAQTLTPAQQAQAKTNLGLGTLTGLTIYAARTAAQGVPTAAQCAAAGYPDGAFFTVDPA